MSNYSANTIESLDYFEHIRRYPGMYIGSKDINGLHHCIKEIISNSIDEYLNGAGSEIIIKIQQDGGIYIKDNGRGIPHGEHEKGVSVLQACFGIQNTGGKFNNATGETGYNTSGGEHGTGGKAVNALSTKMIVTTAREGIKEIVEFSKGQFISHKEEKSNEQGTSVLFYPDAEIFETVTVDINKLRTMIREFSYLCKGLNFIYITNKEERFYSEKGLYDYLDYLSTGKDSICEPIYLYEEDKSFTVEAAIGYINGYSGLTKIYTNNIPQEKGTHLTGFKTAWTSTLNQFAREKKWLKDKDENLTGSDFEEGQILILNFKMIDPVFKGQNKEELSSSEGRTYVQKLITLALKNYLIYNEKNIKIIIDKALDARKAREAAKKARDAARNKTKKKEKVVKFDSKLADCSSKDRQKCEIFITEGDSASGGMKLARDNSYQAILPVRGKILNCQKATIAQIQKNAEIMTMLEAFGLEIDVKSMKVIYNESDLRYGSIIIASDADVDGAHIKNLFYTFIWNFAPELIINGHIYASQPPLYKVTFAGNKGYKYIKNDEELEKFREANKGTKYEVGRMKGLGEMDPEELEETMLNPDNRIIKQITMEDMGKTKRLFEDLMGDKVLPRKEYIEKHSEETYYNAE